MDRRLKLLVFFLYVSAYGIYVIDGKVIAKPSSVKLEQTAIAGRILEIPAKDYISGFKVPSLKLGECAMKMQGTTIQTCMEKFSGTEMWISRASSVVDVMKVRTAGDILTYGMGSIGANIGILGLVGASSKHSVAVRTQTSSKHLNLMTSYDIRFGVASLHNPFPLTEVTPEGAIFLSEIEYAGSEMLLVTMEFEDTRTKVEIEMQLQIKILFITISAKLKFVHENFNAMFKTRIQFKSSWRPQQNIDNTYSSMETAIEEAEEIEAAYILGPKELSKMNKTDENLQQTYYFSFWKKSPYENDVNFAAINNDMDILNSQYTEIDAVIQAIAESFDTKLIDFLDPTKKKAAENLKQNLTNLRDKIVAGLNSYHTLSDQERSQLLDIYGRDNAPGYYERKFKRILV